MPDLSNNYTARRRRHGSGVNSPLAPTGKADPPLHAPRP